MFRRSLLITAAAAPLAACGLLTISGSTVTFNLAEIDNYATAVESGAKLLLALPVVAGPLGIVGVAAANAALTAVADGIATLDKTYAGQVSLSFNVSSPPDALTAFIGDVKSLYAGFTSVAPASLTGAAAQYYDAFQTIVALVGALVPSLNVGAAANGPQVVMPEAQALAVLGVKG